MRGTIPELPTPHRIATTLPAILWQDHPIEKECQHCGAKENEACQYTCPTTFVRRMCAGFDVVLAPVFSTLDCLEAYLDAGTAPADMLRWLAGWIGLVVEDGQPLERQRELVLAGADLHRWRGTMYGIRAAVMAVYSVAPEVAETGGVGYSLSAGGRLPGRSPAELVVRLPVADPDRFDERRLHDLVAAIKPAHVPHRVEVYRRPDVTRG